MTERTPASYPACASATSSSTESWNTPGIDFTGFRTRLPGSDEQRPDEVVRGEGRLADEAAERLVAAHAAGAILGEGHGGFSTAICGCGQRRRGAAGRRYGRSQGFTSRNTRPLWRRG